MEVLSFSHLVSGKYSDIPFDLTIGVFDGMHRGHRKIIDALLDSAKKDFASSLIITFDRNPKRKGLPFLDSENMRLEKFRSTGVDFLAVIDFSPDFAKMSALEFASLLSENLYLKRLVVGRDFKCGCPSRQLDGKGLAEAVSKPGMDVQVTFVDYLMLPDGERISSSLIRETLAKGDMEEYFLLSGQSFLVDMKVFPSSFRSGVLTISFSPQSQLLPSAGAYDATILDDDGSSFDGLLELDGQSGRFVFSSSLVGCRVERLKSLVIRRRR